MRSKKECKNCTPKANGFIKVDNVSFPHCIDCGREILSHENIIPMNQPSKQLKEKIEDILRANFDPFYGISNGLYGRGENEIKCEVVAEVILDSVREEYKGMIEQIKIKEKHTSYQDKDGVRYLDQEAGYRDLVRWEEGYNKAVDEFNSKIDELLKQL